MQFQAGELYHVFNQGNNRQKIFFGRDNYLFFLKKMKTHLIPHCDLMAWCLMPNHFHWMIRIPEDYPDVAGSSSKDDEIVFPVIQPLNRSISTLLSSYSKAINKAFDRSGSLFRPRTKARLLTVETESDDLYPLICFLYIHQNPVRAGLSENLQLWEFSSYKDYADLRNGSLCNLNLTRELLDLPASKEEFIRMSNRTIPETYLNRFTL